MQILDLATGKAIEFEHLYPGLHTDQNSLIWSPDGKKLVFTILINPCDVDLATTIAIIDISKNHQQIIIDKDKRQFHTDEWIDDDMILVVSDWSDNPEFSWYLNIKTGELTPINQ